MKSPAHHPDWRKSAEFPAKATSPLRGAISRCMFVAAAGPSNNTPAADCQNRYPSPSKRSDHFSIRPLTLWGRARGGTGASAALAGADRQVFARIGVAAKKPFASACRNGSSGGISLAKKGMHSCRTNFRSLRSAPCLRCRPVAKRCCSRGSWGPVRAPRRPRSWAATPLPALRWAARPMCYIAGETPDRADRVAFAGASVPGISTNGHRGATAVAVLRLSVRAASPGQARPGERGQCSRKS